MLAFVFSLKMFTVTDLRPFPNNAKPFTMLEEVASKAAEHGLVVDEVMSAGCPLTSLTMHLPHIFTHVYAGLQMLERGREEWNMCKILSKFVEENKREISDATKVYFKPFSTSVTRFSTALTKRFRAPNAAQVYLFVRACNAHTRMYFSNCTWTTLEWDHSFYVAVHLAAIGDNFVVLSHPEQETFECVVGQITELVDPSSVCVATSAKVMTALHLWRVMCNRVGQRSLKWMWSVQT